ncbi:GMC oxidoreductase [Cyanobium sp. ULC084]
MTASQQDDLSGFDAIVVGSGATGGVAAMVLADAGLSVLVLEAGPDLAAARAIGSEPLNMLRRLSRLSSGAQRLQAQHPGYWKANPDLFVDEGQNPYTTPPGRPFLWSRGRQVGGKSLTWGGITLRLSDFEFQAGERDGLGPSWPIGTADLAPYYGRLERLLGVHGQRDGLAQLPDGDYLDPYPFTPAERHLRRSIAAELDLPLIHSRGFALGRRSADQPWPRSSSQAGALGRALATGRVTVRANAVVSHVELAGGAGSAFIPNTLNLGDGDGLPFQRGYGIWAGVQRFDPPNLLKRRRQEAVGFLIGHGEVLPEAHNRLTLNSGAVDAWGLPTPHIDCRWGENETRLVEHMQARMAAVVAAAGGRIAPLEDLFLVPLAEPLLRRAVALSDGAPPPGYYIHELGGARMAAAPEQGVLDRWNRCWQAPNLLVTDGACWPSSGWQSPTLTEMAITWRACERAAADLVSGS